MEIKLNGNKKILNNEISVSELVKSENMSENGTAVALNGKICLRKDWQNTILKDGDNVNLISAAFGG